MTRFDEIRARLRKATPGPWHPNPDGTGEEGDGCVWFEDANLGRVDVICGTAFWNKADADLIAHAPADLAYLLEIIDALATPPETRP